MLVSLVLAPVITVGVWLALVPGSTPAGTVASRDARSSQQRLERPPPSRAKVAAAAPSRARPRPEVTSKPEPAEEIAELEQEAEEGEEEDALEAPRVESFEQIRARQAREQASVHERLERRFSEQGVDPAWRHQAESQLIAGVQGISGPDLQLESSRCREDVCITVVKHDGAEIDGDRLTRFIFASAKGLEHRFKYEPGRMTVYSMRRDSSEQLQE